MNRGHHDLVVWRESVELAKYIYELTANYPKEENFGLISQARRAAVSISANIAEGAARSYKKEFLQFLMIARGSLSELETLIIISSKVGYIGQEQEIEAMDKIDHIGGLLNGLITSVRAKT